MATNPQLARPADAPPEMDPQILAIIQAGANKNYAAKEDPPVWEFNNPLTGIWTGKDPTQFGYIQKPRSKALSDFYSLSRDEVMRFQELAFQAGLYGSAAEREDIPWGARDPETFEKWQLMVDQAVRYGAAGKKFTIWDSIQELVDNRPESLGKDKRKRPPLITQLPDPREVEEMVRGVAPSVIGRDPSPEFTQDFIAMYTRIVSEFQANKYALEGTEAGGEITAPPSAEALASFRLRTENPEQYEEKRSAARSQAYTALLKGAL
jgi:hypothetical protein